MPCAFQASRYTNNNKIEPDSRLSPVRAQYSLIRLHPTTFGGG